MHAHKKNSTLNRQKSADTFVTSGRTSSLVNFGVTPLVQPQVVDQSMQATNVRDARASISNHEALNVNHNFSRIPINLTSNRTGAGKSKHAQYRRYSETDARGGSNDGGVVDQRHGAGGGGAAVTPTPTPINVRNGPNNAVINNGDRVGMSIAIAISSSSGRDADMSRIQDSEQVGLSYNHTGCMSGVSPLPSSQSGFMSGYPIPDDQHAWSKRAIIDLADNSGGSGSFEKQQLDIYKDAAAGVSTAIAIPASGYIIKRTITKSGEAISFKTEKRAAAASVNGYSTTAGPSATYSKDVTIRFSRAAKTAIGVGAGALIGAGAGAAIGAFGGPIGAGAGAVIGGVLGGIGSLFF